MNEANRQPGPERQSPHDPDAEMGILGSIMQPGSRVMDDCCDRLTPAHFYIPAHQIVYSALSRMHEARHPIDLITLTNFLRDDGQLDQVGGPSFPTTLQTFVPTAANADYYIDIVRRKYIRRRTIAVCTELIRQNYEENIDEHILLDQAQAEITALAIDAIKQDSLRHIEAGVQETLDKIERIYHNRGDAAVDGIETGIIDFDRMTSGLKKQQLIVIAARPSQGKTSLGMNMAAHMAFNGVPVAVFSMEMSYIELVERMVFCEADLSLKLLRSGFFEKADLPRVQERAGKILTAPLYIDDSARLWITDFKARARRAVIHLGVKVIVVDYLQLMVSPSRRAQENRVLEITEITGGLKAIAKELNVPIIVMAQLNREAEKREFGRPKASDLRESGSIEQDADIVALIWRPIRHCETKADYKKLSRKLGFMVESEYNEENDGKRARWKFVSDTAERDQVLNAWTQLIVAKQRNGPVGDIELRFESDITKFQNVTQKSWSNREDERQGHIISETAADDDF